MKVSIEQIKYLNEQRRKINAIDLDSVEFYENHIKVKIDQKIIDDFKYTGLNNVDFILSGFYKTGWDEEETS